MSLEHYSLLLSIGLLTLTTVVLSLVFMVVFSPSYREKIMQVDYVRWLLLIGSIAILATMASLTYQFIYKTPVCELCWWQRIFLYPIEVIAAVAIWKKTKEAHITVAILAAIGLFFASYHYYYHFQAFVLGNKFTLPCSYGGLLPACTDSPILVFGFITIPFMAVLTFIVMLSLAWLAHQKLANTSSESQYIKTNKLNQINPNSMEMPYTIEEKADGVKPQEQIAKISSAQKQWLNYVAILSATLLILFAYLYSQGVFVAATVNGSPISRLSVINKLEDQSGSTVLDAIISDKLIAQAAAEAGITVTDAVVAAEMVAIEAQIAGQGGTLEEVLVQQGLNHESLMEQIKSQKILEALMADKITVSEEEINAFIKANGPLPVGQEESLRPLIAEQLKNQKISTAAQNFVTDLRTQANIKYLVDYK